MDRGGFPESVPVHLFPYRIIVDVTPTSEDTREVEIEWPEHLDREDVAQALQLAADLVPMDAPGVTRSGDLVGEVRNL